MLPVRFGVAAAVAVGLVLAGCANRFEEEPYTGPLRDFDRCILTCHMGSMSVDCRTRMEIEATEEAVRFLRGDDLQRLAPEDEYLVQAGV